MGKPLAEAAFRITHLSLALWFALWWLCVNIGGVDARGQEQILARLEAFWKGRDKEERGEEFLVRLANVSTKIHSLVFNESLYANVSQVGETPLPTKHLHRRLGCINFFIRCSTTSPSLKLTFRPYSLSRWNARPFKTGHLQTAVPGPKPPQNPQLYYHRYIN